MAFQGIIVGKCLFFIGNSTLTIPKYGKNQDFGWRHVKKNLNISGTPLWSPKCCKSSIFPDLSWNDTEIATLYLKDSPTYTYIYIYIYIYGPHLISWADILHFWHFCLSFIVKNAPILQPTNCGCTFVFLFSSFSLLLPFSALFFLFFLCFYQSQSLKIAHQLRCAAYMAHYIYIYRVLPL